MTKEKSSFFTRRMFLKQFIPAAISALGLSLSDMADAVVLGQSMGVTGLAAISLALPVFMVINVCIHGLGLGGSIYFSARLAEGRKSEARENFGGILSIACFLSFAMAAMGALFLPEILCILGTTPGDGEIYRASGTYVRIILLGAPLFFLSYILNYYLRNDDKEKLAGFGFTVGNLVDIGLNILLVLVFDMGVKGAAYSTLAGQIVPICFYVKGIVGKDGNLNLFHVKPDILSAFNSFKKGLSSSVSYLYTMVFLLFANRILMQFHGGEGVAVFELIQNLSFLTAYMFDGTVKAMQPLVSTYFGERNRNGMRDAFKIAAVWGAILGVILSALMFLFPKTICGLFGIHTKEAVLLGCRAVLIYTYGILSAGINTLIQGFLQAGGEEKSAWVLATLRGTVLLLPVTVFCACTGIEYFWFLYPVTELSALIVFLLWYKFFGKGKKQFDDARIYSCTIENKNEELEPLIFDIEAFCEKWDADSKQRYFVTMTVEELCAAIMLKGFADTSGYIQLTLIAQEEGTFSLHVRDNAVSFNPFSLETQKAGKNQDNFDMDAMGILVIRKKAKDFFYRRYQGFNVLIVQI